MLTGYLGLYFSVKTELEKLHKCTTNQTISTYQKPPNPNTGFQTLSFQQFHVLFHSLFRVLFIFPSRYLFAIGLLPVFSLGWTIPPVGVAIPNNSTLQGPTTRPDPGCNGILTLCDVLFQRT